ncbi:DUF6603 domain-containing protein [Solirubrobacter soli]|uniref:DUF6603 domain-containing protein n=1 Tax=Solirubrobacter soli TaxID=363832 RepID=UPI0003F5B7B6|nr:DUF6603 domain-containing protein [Solirubrobacter soli]
MTLFNRLATELGAFLYPLDRAATIPGALEKMLLELGALPDTDTANLADALQAIVAEKRAIDALNETATPSFAAIAELLESSQQVVAAIDAITEGDDALDQLGGFGRDLGELLVGAWLTALHPIVHQVLVLLTLIELSSDQPFAPVQLNGPTPVRLPYRIDRVHLDRIVDLVKDPAEVLRDEYADAVAEKLFPRVAGLLQVLGVPVRYGIHPRDVAALADSAPLLAKSLIVYVDQPLNVPAASEAGAMFSFTPDLGLVVNPFGALATTRAVGPFTVALDLAAGAPAFAYGAHGLTLATGATSFAAGLTATRQGQPPFIVGSPTGTRLELPNIKLGAQTALTSARQLLELGADVDQAALVVAPADGDSFLASILPRDGLRAELSAGLVWSNERGLTFRGSAGLDATIPVDLTLAGVGLSAVNLGLHARDGALDAEISAALKAAIGPVQVAIDGVGVRATLDFADGGNLGGADLDIGFRAPTELGLAIDGGPVTGSGSLLYDPARGQYAGDVRLQFEGLAVRATGLLTTGAQGFSLLVIISADFPPVQLGMGFMLVGVGGLLGINRTIAVDALRAGLKSGALGAVLSPPDPKASAGQLVATLARLFPPAQGRHVFAPTARIVWGQPTLITIELALALELPSPVRLVVLGRLRALLPDEHEPIVRLQVDLLGVIDFDRAEAAVDATLVDSRLAQFALTGDMALRMNWGSRPSFLLAVGGFHPRFAAPPGFPALDRVAIALASGDNPKLRLEAYLALTSNTVQFGARVDLAARAGSFSIAGFLSFDALVTLSPLAFVVDIAAKLAVKVGSRTLLSISLSLTLSGPRPWRARGRASFSILFFDVSFGFDVTIGDATAPALPAPVDVAPLVLAALTDARAWTAQLPAGADVVTLRALQPGAAVLAHPLGTLRVRQRLAPLERTLERFGTTVPSGAKRFRITLATIGGVRTTLTPLQDQFAPAQFTALSDDAKLSAPSFEPMTSGAALGADGFITGTGVTVAVNHEQLIVTAVGIPEPKSTRVPIPGDVFDALTATTPARAPAFALKVVA